MKDESSAEFNPYQAPTQSTIVEPEKLDGWPTKVRRFRGECQALAGAILVFGAVGLLISVLALSLGSASSLVYGTIPIAGGSLLSVCAVVVGVGIGMKKITAIRIVVGGLYMTPAILGAMFPRAAVGVIFFGYFFLVLVIAQAHRVLGWAREMESAGIPLTTRPEKLRAEMIARILQEPAELT